MAAFIPKDPAAKILGTTRLELPREIQDNFQLSAADIGVATHLALQHLDFTRSCDADDVKKQLAAMVQKRLLTKLQAAGVKIDPIVWLAQSAVGELIRNYAPAVHRELPLYYAKPVVEAVSDDPQDRVMVRSRIDVLVQTPDGLEIVDYKSDRVTAETIKTRKEMYRAEMEFYRTAIEATGAGKVTKVHLVFLAAQAIESL